MVFCNAFVEKEHIFTVNIFNMDQHVTDIFIGTIECIFYKNLILNAKLYWLLLRIVE
jgi:hypothetical protein